MLCFSSVYLSFLLHDWSFCIWNRKALALLIWSWKGCHSQTLHLCWFLVKIIKISSSRSTGFDWAHTHAGLNFCRENLCEYGLFWNNSALRDRSVDEVQLFICFNRDARVMRDLTTNKSKGYGFVSFVQYQVINRLRPLKTTIRTVLIFGCVVSRLLLDWSCA